MKAGFGRSDITPRLGVQLAGYGPYRNRAARAHLAPLSARAMAVSEGSSRALLLSLELVGVAGALADRIRAAVAKRIGCRTEEIFLSATHTHSGPAVGGMFGWGEADALYVETLAARAADAAEEAWKARVAAKWSYAEVPCEGIAVNRETDTGFAMNENFAERLDPRWRPARPQDTDPTVRVLAARDAKGRLLGLLHHFGCHPVVCGEQTTDVHGDFVGLASIQLEKAHPGAVAIFLLGAQGDINPVLNHRNPRESRQALRVLGRRYAGVIARALRAAHPIGVGRTVPSTPILDSEASGILHVIARRPTFARTAPSRKKIEQRIAALEKRFSAPGLTDSTTVGKPPLHTSGMEMVRLQGLRSVLAQFHGNRAPNPPVPLQGLRIGPVALLGCGLEVYHSLQAGIMAGSPHPHTWVVSLVGGKGYAPDAAAQKRAGYSYEFVPLILGELPYRRVHAELPRALIKLARDL